MRARFGLRLFLQRFVVACVVVSVLFAAAVAVSDRYATHEYAKRTTVRIDDGILAAGAPAKPANFLLIGNDTTGLIDDDKLPDTMMIVHVDPAVRTPLLVSLPRDLILNVPGYGLRQINAAYALGGASLLIKTIETDLRIPINHYLEVDFAGFQTIVNAIGHLSVWFPTPVHDPYVGLDVEHAGCVPLNGAMALAYARSRHYYVPDNLTDPAPWSWNYPAQ